MSKAFVIQNQDGHYWSKQKDWTDGRDRRIVYRTAEKDEVINLVFELSSKDVDLRAHYLECEVDDIGNPRIEASDIPLPTVDTGEPNETGKKETADAALETVTERPHIVSDNH